MANTNTIKEIYGATSPNFYPQFAPLVNPQSATAFTLAANNVPGIGLGGTSVAGVLQLLSAASFGGPGNAPVGSKWDNGQAFRIRAFGTVASNSTTNVTLSLYQVPSAIVAAGTAATLTNDNAITGATSGTKACTSNTSNFLLIFDLNWNSASQTLTGTVDGYVASTIITKAAITPLTVTADTELNFLLTGLYGASNAANIATLNEFSIEQV